jgi:eukaryotic-like serine/threonine-protein kinase
MSLPTLSPRMHDAPISIGGYRILRRIGQGAMSTVYLAYDVRLLRQVAVKVLADHLAGNKQFVNRFYREAQLSKQLHHGNIVRGLDFGFDNVEQTHYLVLEFVDGFNASDWMAQHGALSVTHVLRIGIQIAEALQHLHFAGLIHRDVKPENLLLGHDGSAKLADLGLAKRCHGDVELTTADQGVGTPHYMPYEQSVNGELVDHRSDLFALGATLYHLLTGRLPFRGETHEEIVREKELDAYCPAREHRPDVPPILDMILAQALARDPRARFQSGSEFIAALANVPMMDDVEAPVHRPVPQPEHHANERTQPEFRKLPAVKYATPVFRITDALSALLVGVSVLLVTLGVRAALPPLATQYLTATEGRAVWQPVKSQQPQRPAQITAPRL